MQINKIHNIDFLNNTLTDKCAQLIIADPPYFEVKGSFDFIWKSFDDYLKDVEKWAIECKRILSDNGSLFWYGHAKKLAYSQIILDKYFNLENSIVWEKSDCQTKKGTQYYRSFSPVSERILFYSKYDYHNAIRQEIAPIQDYLNTIISKNELAELLFLNGFCKSISSAKSNANNILSNKESKPQFITEPQYNLIDNVKKIPYNELKNMLLERKRVFNNYLGLFDVVKFSQETNKSALYDHETIKPEALTRALILTCSRENDLIVVPFAGSGTECAMSAKENRNFVGFDIEHKFVEMSNKRCSEYLRTQSLFS